MSRVFGFEVEAVLVKEVFRALYETTPNECQIEHRKHREFYLLEIRLVVVQSLVDHLYQKRKRLMIIALLRPIHGVETSATRDLGTLPNQLVGFRFIFQSVTIQRTTKSRFLGLEKACKIRCSPSPLSDIYGERAFLRLSQTLSLTNNLRNHFMLFKG